ncbi:MAG: gamma-glutamyl-gamma-aminobutyrate hydrolase family protein [Planctomycetota bacterium]|nr:MAG: gamma-glutamyl-gamma-aminobutyrate hydrolase family protein [Planctomycetota bacterium]
MNAPPRIGIEVDLEATEAGRRYAKCYEAYFDAVLAAGGTPILLPPCPPPALGAQLACVDALVVPGGDDFHAREWGEEQRPCERFVEVDPRRLAAGRRLLEAALAQGLPVLGVCYGMQLLCLVRGGRLVQDIPQEVACPLDHDGAGHPLEVEPGTLLAALLGGERAEVNSRHHQAVREPGDGLRVSARAPDGVVEAIEGTEGFLLGVQWHCEELGESPGGLGLFRGLVEAARARAALHA